MATWTNQAGLGISKTVTIVANSVNQYLGGATTSPGSVVRYTGIHNIGNKYYFCKMIGNDNASSADTGHAMIAIYDADAGTVTGSNQYIGTTVMWGQNLATCYVNSANGDIYFSLVESSNYSWSVWDVSANTWGSQGTGEPPNKTSLNGVAPVVQGRTWSLYNYHSYRYGAYNAQNYVSQIGINIPFAS